MEASPALVVADEGGPERRWLGFFEQGDVGSADFPGFLAQFAFELAGAPAGVAGKDAQVVAGQFFGVGHDFAFEVFIGGAAVEAGEQQAGGFDGAAEEYRRVGHRGRGFAADDDFAEWAVGGTVHDQAEGALGGMFHQIDEGVLKVGVNQFGLGGQDHAFEFGQVVKFKRCHAGNLAGWTG